MSNSRSVPEELVVGRSDPAYMAHAYLTKVPIPAITPFIAAYSNEGDVVVDPFAGSGMTGVAAASLRRRARLFDISVLGQHIGRNYANLVNQDLLRKTADELVSAVRSYLGDVYGTKCRKCSETAKLVKTIWSYQFQCAQCSHVGSFYRAMEASGWSKKDMQCSNCGLRVPSGSERIGEIGEVDCIECGCSTTQIEQAAATPPAVDLDALPYPRVEITPDRQMYKTQSLGRSGLISVSSFYSKRNLAVLTVLREGIREVEDKAIRDKLLFAFTACLTRASKRYQWSPMRPLNAANANYYVAAVFYEWNVFDLFLRKVEAACRSDNYLRLLMQAGTLFDSDDPEIDVSYELSSAESIPLADSSVDYVFTDPPFGSNLFYADMALFQEAWLEGFTDVSLEAVVDRGSKKVRSASRYEGMLTNALSECRRILKPGGHVSMVFGNSTGSVWSLVQRSIKNAGLLIDPHSLAILNKGQRSVKGLASGFEHVATLDLIITMTAGDDSRCFKVPTADQVGNVAREIARGNIGRTPSHVYLEILRMGIRESWDLSAVHLRDVTQSLIDDGWQVASGSGALSRA
ncbi:hypothetical protein ND748_03010 [Frankia sp. AiPs1]|uniref:DNA methyltransferase n=1 Tax=Frankia sp. AiPs1 TaxID=573493 RepID=UPI0020439BC4|nr:DNA methyltransferase [Frankia sp. AiPs1]MCM3920647.1 hypothetical protein [Frankia sp. AiPs1]